jgi:Ca-activated chloride channel homolog
MGKRELPPALRDALEQCAELAVGTLIAWLLLATLQAQVAHGAEFPQDVGAGTLVFQRGDDYDTAAPLSTDVRISVAGIVARVAVAQRFTNSSGDWAEAVYVLPLPDDAAVDRLVMRVGERLIEGEVHEREHAERVYAAARDAGKRASLVRQTSANLFTTAVANIAPGESLDVTIEYLQTARYDAGELSLRFPMTLTPRYGERDSPEQRATPTVDALPRAQGVLARAPDPTTPRSLVEASAAYEASLRVLVAPGLPLAWLGSPSHATRDAKDGDHYVLETLAPRVPMDRDFVVAWRPQVGSSPAVAALTETRGASTYALLMIVPPAELHAWSGAPRELICVIDTSGSMGGQPIEQAKAALANALQRLTGADRFNLLQFNSWTASLFEEPQPLTPDSYAQAQRWVAGLRSTGGTEMEPAIRAALAQPAAPGYLRQIIFITDGAVASETRLFGAIKNNLGNARLFTVGIGAAPNSYFMRKAAQFGRGTYTHIANAADVATSMQALFDKLEHVALTDVLVGWPDATEVYPAQAPDLYAGEPIVIAASFPAGDAAAPLALRAFGRAAGMQWSSLVEAEPSTLPGIAELWARRKIEYVIDSRVDGTDESLIRKLVVDVALEHHLVSPYTSLVAVDKTPARSTAAALERKNVANVAPAGVQWTGLPQTATWSPIFRSLGAFLIAVAVAVTLLRKLARAFWARWARDRARSEVSP